MFGSNFFKIVNGSHKAVGYMTTENFVIPEGVTIPKGTIVDSLTGDDTKQVFASGQGIGHTTQDVTLEGQTSLSEFKNRVIGKRDLPIKIGQAVTVRQFDPGAELEMEGLGAAGPGNLVATTGTGAISDSTARKTELSAHIGSLRVAQTGELVMYHMEDAGLTPYTEGNVRVRISVVSPYVKS